MTKRIYLFIVTVAALAVAGIVMNRQPGGLSPALLFAADHTDHADADEYGDTHADEHEDEPSGAHGEEQDRDVIELDMSKVGFKLRTVKVCRGVLALTLDLPGEVRWNGCSIFSHAVNSS